jgi:hypothetical protein
VAAWVFVLESVVLVALFPKLAANVQYSVAIRPILVLLIVLSVAQAVIALYRQSREDEKTE